jgi:aminoglycoside/choline kinase family phosphotransferase
MNVDRIRAIEDWLHTLLNEDFEMEPASEDASFRRYFRVTHQGKTHIVMDAPPDKEDVHPFIDIARRLEMNGVHVPHLFDADLEQGFLLLSDLGSTSYLSALSHETVDSLYGDALQALLKIQTANINKLPYYNRELLHREMELFREWYLGRHLGLPLDRLLTARLETIYETLIQSALAQPRVFVHRDYHSRNLMLIDENNPGVIDFQDAVIGPVTYDLVSLLRDCYIDWPRERVEAWALQYRDMAVEKSIIDAIPDEQFLSWFDLMGVQRHLKATGIFARLNYRDGKSGYMNDIPRTLGYVYEVCGRHEVLQELKGLLDEIHDMDKFST